ncbi:MAG TPA: outer membrane protein assembly factor BamC [Rhodocyclaceae bacterium]
MRRAIGNVRAGQRLAGRVGITLLVVALAGCAMFDSKVDYKSVKRDKPLEVPPELTVPQTGDRFAIPGAAASTTYSDYERSRAGSRAAPSAGIVLQPESSPTVRIERAGTQRWLVVQAPPEQVWAQLKEFWQSQQIPLELELPAVGVMETKWVEERAKFSAGAIRDMLSRVMDVFYSNPERNKFRTRIEKGIEPGTTEVYISHRQMFEMFVDEGQSSTRWQPQPAQPGIEAEMLRRFVVFTGVGEKAARELIVAQSAPTPDRSRLVEREGRAALEMDERFDRAWRRTGLSLDRIGFTVEDRNRAEGVFFVRYLDSDAAALRESKKGFFSWLAFWQDDEEEKIQTEFRVVVMGENDRSYVTVRPRKDGDPEDLPTGRKILTLLNEQLR